jgi:single-strand DNA-binding protein
MIYSPNRQKQESQDKKADMAFRTSGKLLKVFDVHQVSEKFRKREFVVEIADGKYPQLVSFQLTGDKCALLDSIEDGETVDIEFNLRGREWTSPKGEVRYFNTLDAWSVKFAGGNGQRSESKREQPGQAAFDGSPIDDDIPFAWKE